MPVAFRNSAVNASTATTRALTKPGSVVNGDLLLLLFLMDNTAKTVTASQWTQIRNDNDTTENWRVTLLWRIEDGTALSALTWDATSIYSSGMILAYSGVDRTSPIAAHNGQNNAASTNVTAPSITPGVTGTMGVWIGSNDQGISITVPGGWTTRKINNFDTQPAELALASAAATGSIVGTHSSNRSMGQLLALRPATLPNRSRRPAPRIAAPQGAYYT